MTQATQEKIIDAFLKLAIQNPNKSSFSMTEIANAAGMSRQAIYQKHFRNTDEIIEYIHRAIDKKIIIACQDYVNHTDMSLHFFITEKILPIIYEDRERIKALYATTASLSWKKFLQDVYSQWIEQQLKIKTEGFTLSEKTIRHIATSIAISFIEGWMIEEEPMPLEDFKKEFLKLVHTPLRDFFD